MRNEVCNYIKIWEKEGVSGYSSSYLLGYQSNKFSFVLEDLLYDCSIVL